jgi:hypothetical protein
MDIQGQVLSIQHNNHLVRELAELKNNKKTLESIVSVQKEEIEQLKETVKHYIRTLSADTKERKRLASERFKSRKRPKKGFVPPEE